MKISTKYCFIISLFFAFLLICCSKDKGNYNYQTVNQLHIVDQEGNRINQSIYNLMLDEEYTLSPKITGSIYPIKADQLDFYWIVGRDTMSRDKFWKIDASVLGVGGHFCKLLVIDNQTGLSYANAFFVSVRAGIHTGSIILTTNEQQESLLIMHASAIDASYIYRDSFGGVRLGKQPVDIEVIYQQGENATRSYQQVLMTTKEGDFPMFAVDLMTLKPTLMLPARGVVLSGELLHPSYYLQENDPQVSNDRFDGMLLINGKCYSLERGIISNDVYRTDPLNYDFGDHALAYNGRLKGYVLAGYDKRNQRIRVFHNWGRGGVFTDNFDNSISPQLTVGHSFIAARSFIVTDTRGENINWQFLTRKATQIHMINIDSDNIYVRSVEVIVSKSVPEMVDGIGFKFHDGYWYFAKGRTIYRFADTGLDVESYLTLPEDQSGDIAAWNFYKNTTSQLQKIGVATYDPVSPRTRKGSYYLYDTQSKRYELQDRNIIDKAVDIELCY